MSILLVVLVSLLARYQDVYRGESAVAQVPIISKIPWKEVNGTITTPEEITEFSSSGTPDQVVHREIMIPTGSLLEAACALLPDHGYNDE